MKIRLMTALAWTMGTLFASGFEDMYVKAMRVDGLPSRFFGAKVLDRNPATGKTVMDLGPEFAREGCGIPEGGFISYDTATGFLVRRLNKETHEIVDGIIDDMYRAEHQLATCRAYYALLEPLTPRERLDKVLLIGFLPDPLVANMIDQTRSSKSVFVPEGKGDPFSGDPPPPPRTPSKAELDRISEMEKTLSALLEISMQRLKAQLAVMDAARPGTWPEAAAQPPPTVPPSGTLPKKEGN